MEIIGRIEEIKEFQQILASEKSEFLAVFGRRRIGKTFLVRQYFKDQFSLYLTGLENGTKQKQLDNFYNVLLPNFTLKKNDKKATNWLDAFQHLQQYLAKEKKKKKVIFLDELPWLATAKSDFMLALDNFWNHWASARTDIVLIVCGSAASWIIENVLQNKGGLHNRVTRRMKLLPFTLKETELFLKKRKFNVTQYEIAKLYMCLGGIPFYLDLLDNKISLAQNIDKLCFTPKGALRDEFNELYKSLFKDATKHIDIIKTLALKAKGLQRTEILQLAKLPNAGSTTRILDELEESGFITKYQNYGKQTKDAIYQLTDYFTLFHFKFIAKSSVLDTGIWLKQLDTPKQKVWSGFTFELLCLHHIQNIKAKLGISGIETHSTVWQNKYAQIDLVIDRRDNVISICEIKFSKEKFLIDKKYFENLQNKIAQLRYEAKATKSLQMVMLTTFGLAPSKYNNAIIQQSITLQDLFM
jgi:uncharacterized protein